MITLWAEASRITTETGRAPFYRVILFERDDETGCNSVQDIIEVDQLTDVASFEQFEPVHHVRSATGEIVETDCLSLAEALEASL